jgi:hypothetical protein
VAPAAHLNAPLGRGPPRSRDERPLGQGPRAHVTPAPARTSEHLMLWHRRTAPRPRHAWESRPDAVPPTPWGRPSTPLYNTVRRGQCHLRGAVPPTSIRLTRRALEGDGGTLEWGRMLFLWLHKTTPWRQASGNGLLRRYEPCAAIPATATPRRALWRHPWRCWSARGREVATPTIVPRTASRWRHHRAGPRAAAGQPTSMPPPLKPPLYGHRTRHDTPTGARFSRTAIYSMALYAMPLHVGEIVWHTCKLLPPWPIKGGAVP